MCYTQILLTLMYYTLILLEPEKQRSDERNPHKVMSQSE